MQYSNIIIQLYSSIPSSMFRHSEMKNLLKQGGIVMPNILLIDDNPEILEANKTHLTGEGYNVATADTGTKAIKCMSAKYYDCIVMDIMLPDIDGFSLCKSARSVTTAPIIFLSCIDAPNYKIKGLMLGGDDYMTKPYNLDELTARIHAHLRREQSSGRYSSFGEVYIDKKNRMVQTPESNVFMTQKELELLLLLLENPDRKFSKEEILKTLWEDNVHIGTVAVHILKLRRKLDFAKLYIGVIENDYKHGYYISGCSGTKGIKR